MKMTKWTEAFLASTKGRIVSLLRGMGRTVNDLANALKLTDNAVRAQQCRGTALRGGCPDLDR